MPFHLVVSTNTASPQPEPHPAPDKPSACSYDRLMAFPRISHDPATMGGKPCIRGLRITAGTIVGLVASGSSRERILQAYPLLEPADIDEALAYAAWRMEEREEGWAPVVDSRRGRGAVRRGPCALGRLQWASTTLEPQSLCRWPGWVVSAGARQRVGSVVFSVAMGVAAGAAAPLERSLPPPPSSRLQADLAALSLSCRRGSGMARRWASMPLIS